MDPFHVCILHSNFSTLQFTELVAIRPDVKWEYTEFGVKSMQNRDMDDGKVFHRVTEIFMPNIRLVGSPTALPGRPGFGKEGLLSWLVPFDDHTTTFFGLIPFRLDENGEPQRFSRQIFDGKTWFELSEDEHQRMPGDQEAICGQGRISSHTTEHLVTSDRGVMLLRRRLRKQIEAVKSGQDPLGVVLDKQE